MGRTHNKEETFPRLADPIGFVRKDDIYDAVKAIVATQREYGNRVERRLSRMKYLIEDWGVEKFRETVEGYLGKKFEPFRPLPEFKYHDFLGWHDQGDGKLFYGISVENGRIHDRGSLQLKTALRRIVESFNLPMLLTPHQNVLLYDIAPAQQRDIEQILQECGIKRETEIDPLVRYSMACPALPTCGLAIAEAERGIPGVLARIRALLNHVGLPEEHFVVRMTGCPNGCARPYLAELGFVGRSPGAYQVWLGGNPHQTRLAETYIESLAIENLEATLEPLFVYFKQEQLHRVEPESFGDFCHRVGFEALRRFAATYSATPNASIQEMVNQFSSPVNSENVTTSGAEPIAASTSSESSAPVTSGSDSPTGETPAAADSGVPPTPPTPPSGGGGGGDDSEGEDASGSSRPPRRRINVSNEIYLQLKTEAERQGKPMSQLAGDAIDAFLKSLSEQA